MMDKQITFGIVEKVENGIVYTIEGNLCTNFKKSYIIKTERKNKL